MLVSYFDHMIMGMPRQLFDGMIDYEDGTPASTPQMAVDVANFIAYMQRRDGARAPDKKIRNMMFVCGIALAWPIFKLRLKAIFRGMWSYRFESYAVRDNLGYKHWKTGQISIRAADLRGRFWS